MSEYKEIDDLPEKITAREDMDRIPDPDDEETDEREPTYIDGSAVNECWHGEGMVRE